MIEFDNLTYLHGKPQGTGLLKANPEDFVVVEDLGFEPDGEGQRSGEPRRLQRDAAGQGHRLR